MIQTLKCFPSDILYQPKLYHLHILQTYTHLLHDHSWKHPAHIILLLSNRVLSWFGLKAGKFCCWVVVDLESMYLNCFPCKWYFYSLHEKFFIVWIVHWMHNVPRVFFGMVLELFLVPGKYYFAVIIKRYEYFIWIHHEWSQFLPWWSSHVAQGVFQLVWRESE